MDNFLATLEGSPVWERFLRHEHTRMFKGPSDHLDAATIKLNLTIITSIRESFLLAALVDWLDTEGVHIGIYHFKRDNLWRSGIGFDYESSFYTSRSEALKAGIVKAFSLLEKK